MKKFFAIIIFCLSFIFSHAEKLESIKPTDYVTDYTQTLSSDQVLELSKTLGEIKKAKNYDITVVIVDNIDGDYIEHYANKLYEQIGLGNSDTKEGMLWLISKDTHEMRMEVGYGLEPILTDGVTKNIQDNLVRPLFKQGDYYGGIRAGIENVSNILTGEAQIENTNPNVMPNFGNIFQWGLIIMVFGISFFSWLFSVLARSKSWWGGGVAGFLMSSPIFYFIFGLTIISFGSVFILTILGFLFDYLISKNYLYWQNKFKESSGVGFSGGPAWWAGGTGFGGGFKSGGSGFGGFGGGGFSGGGGSSSSW